MPPIDLRGDYITKLNDEYFTSSYWLTTNQFVTLYKLCNNHDNSITIKMLLIYCNYIKQYPTWLQLTNMSGHSTRTTQKFIKKVKNILMELFNLDDFDFNDRLSIEPFIIEGIKIYSVIDTVIFKISKPSQSHALESIYYSVKHKHHGIKFEVVTSNYEGSIHDFRIAKLSGVTDLQLVENERMLGDSGYVSDEYSNFFISPHKGASSEISDYDLVFDSIICGKRQIVENLF
ncbi:hypothetical protein ACTFIZ_007900, partial [Dictyostelium cf. discoideum]